MILFLDTETTGRPKQRNASPKMVDLWPRMVSVAWTASVPANAPCEELIVRPTDYTIPTAASNVHGITTEHAAEHGCDITEVMETLMARLEKCTYIACYNVAFDKNVLLSEAYRLKNQKFIDTLTGIKWYCVMRRVKAHLDINRYIKLAVAHELICAKHANKQYQYHNAGDDVLATRDIMLSILGET